MSPQAEERRFHIRFPFKIPVSYEVMGDELHPPGKVPAEAETVDLSHGGARICLKSRMLKGDTVLAVRISITEVGITLPVLAQVKWIRAVENGGYQAGLMFMV